MYQNRLLRYIPQTPKADPDRRLARLSRRIGAMIGFVMEACQGAAWLVGQYSRVPMPSSGVHCVMFIP